MVGRTQSKDDSPTGHAPQSQLDDDGTKTLETVRAKKLKPAATNGDAKPRKLHRPRRCGEAAGRNWPGDDLQGAELVDTMAAQGLWMSPGGKTPHATLYSAILPRSRPRAVKPGSRRRTEASSPSRLDTDVGHHIAHEAHTRAYLSFVRPLGPSGPPDATHGQTWRRGRDARGSAHAPVHSRVGKTCFDASVRTADQPRRSHHFDGGSAHVPRFPVIAASWSETSLSRFIPTWQSRHERNPPDVYLLRAERTQSNRSRIWWTC